VALSARQKGYFAVRGGAGLVFLGSAALLPPGTTAGLICLGAGVVGALTCLGTNAGGPGEQAGAWAEERRLAQFRAPQGDWPPYRDEPDEGRDSPPG
jgi:hypothetical protein